MTARVNLLDGMPDRFFIVAVVRDTLRAYPGHTVLEYAQFNPETKTLETGIRVDATREELTVGATVYHGEPVDSLSYRIAEAVRDLLDGRDA